MENKEKTRKRLIFIQTQAACFCLSFNKYLIFTPLLRERKSVLQRERHKKEEIFTLVHFVV